MNVTTNQKVIHFRKTANFAGFMEKSKGKKRRVKAKNVFTSKELQFLSVLRRTVFGFHILTPQALFASLLPKVLGQDSKLTLAR